jgi:hypothetical protein
MKRTAHSQLKFPEARNFTGHFLNLEGSSNFVREELMKNDSCVYLSSGIQMGQNGKIFCIIKNVY